MKRLKTLSLFVLLVFVLAACGNSIESIISKKYPVKDTVQSSTDSSNAARIYEAKGQSISQVAQYLQNQMKPKKASQLVDGKQVLVYDNVFVTLTKGKDNPNNTDIEVADYEFVKNNYQPSFFDGLLAGYFLSNLFNVPDWESRQSSRCHSSMSPCYDGYHTSGGHYQGPSKPLTKQPSVQPSKQQSTKPSTKRSTQPTKQPSFRGSSFRGGGPNAGK